VPTQLKCTRNVPYLADLIKTPVAHYATGNKAGLTLRVA